MSGQAELASHETDLIGHWQLRGQNVVGDPACERIERLIAEHLTLLGADASGWSDLYREPDDGRPWELTWPQSEMHGGGPPRLTCLAIDTARDKYGTLVES